MITRLLFLVLLLIPAVAFGVAIDLETNDDGWTIFVPSTDTRICYVDPTNGDNDTAEYYANDDFTDPFEPTSVNAYETYAAAYADTRDGYPDWILIKRGETITGTVGTLIKSGRDADEPFLIGAYGASGLSPMFKTGTSSALSFGYTNKSYIAVSGINFYAHTRDPDGADYVDTTGSVGILIYSNSSYSKTGILIEGCKFSFFESNQIDVGDGTVTDGIVLRRTVIYGNYEEAGGGYVQGLYGSGIAITLDECIFDHNGWYDESGGSIGPADMHNHNTYLSDAYDTVFTNNMFIEASLYNNKFTAHDTGDSYNVTIDNNLYIGGSAAINIGTNYPAHDLRFEDITIKNNVSMRVGYSDHVTSGGSWGLIFAGWDGGYVTNNIFMDKRDSDITNAYAIRISDQTEDVDITGNIIHGLQYSEGIFVQGAEDWGNETDTGWVKSDINFTGNQVQIPTNADYLVSGESSGDMSGVTFNSNTYYSNRSTDDRFQVGSTEYSITTWNSQAWVGTDTWEQVSFTDSSRTVETYMSSIGETNTLAEFITLARAQDRYDWDDNITADAVNDYIRAGFDMDDPYPETYILGTGIQIQ